MNPQIVQEELQNLYNKSVFPNSNFQLQKDSLTAIESVDLMMVTNCLLEIGAACFWEFYEKMFYFIRYFKLKNAV